MKRPALGAAWVVFAFWPLLELGSVDGVVLWHRTIWVHALLLFSPLVLMPLGSVITERRAFSHVETIAALLLGPALLLPAVGEHRGSLLAPLFVLPWLLVRLRIALSTLRTWGKDSRPAPGPLCLDSARVFPAIGAAWLLAHRLGWMPWGFDPLIVLLTAAHFHHAGYTLPLMAGLLANDRPTAFTRRSCTAILTGVPLVAIGITSTHFGIARWVEPIAVTVLVLGALGVAVSQLRLGIVSTPHSSRPAQFAFLISGTSLFIAMLLALSFGLRTLLPQFALGMPQMWAIHGTLNTFGFGLCGLLAWRAQSADQLASPEAPD